MIMTIIGRSLDAWGYIPEFLSEDDPRPAVEQFNTRYLGGWHSFKRFKFDSKRMVLTYPGDPPHWHISTLLFRKEKIHLFESDWVVIEQPDGSWDAARMD